jgi:uncharacterized protein (DUF983 family)
MITTEDGNPPRSLAFGLRGRCPRCGRGRLFEGLLTITPRCSVCGLGFAGHDAGDGPAVFGIFILGFGIAGLAAVVEYLYAPSLWVHVLLWTPIILGGGLLLLRPLKGLTIAIQYRYRSVEDPERPGAT